VAQNSPGANHAVGVDGTFGFFDNLSINTYWARTNTEGKAGDDDSYRGQFEYAGDRYGVTAEHLFVGSDFNPEVGFVRRDDMRKSYGQLRFSPRPRQSTVVRRYSWIGTMDYVENAAGRVETRDIDGEFAIELQNGDRFSLGRTDVYEVLPAPFPIAPGVTLPVGEYDYGTSRVQYLLGLQHKVSGTITAERGSFYDGTRTAISFTRTRAEVSAQLSVEPTVSINRVELPQGSFTTRLAGARIIFAATPSMFVSALLQYNSDAQVMSTNVRLRWEYHPGSEIFVVYNEQRDTRGVPFPGLTNRAFVIKVNRLLRF
jgi:hypothetical protein